MKIETKYNIGDEVWFNLTNTPFKSKVREYIGGKEKLYRCKFFLSTCVCREDELFPTKEEFLKSKKQINSKKRKLYDNRNSFIILRSTMFNWLFIFERGLK